eukprot:12896767-Prorocentrum_lima.AAC.1
MAQTRTTIEHQPSASMRCCTTYPYRLLTELYASLPRSSCDLWGRPVCMIVRTRLTYGTASQQRGQLR